MQLLPEKVLKVSKPLYEISESKRHWYLTYLNHHGNKLVMSQSLADPCLLNKHGGKYVDSLVLSEIDDSLIFGSTEF